jgi:hypothetical protein
MSPCRQKAEMDDLTKKIFQKLLIVALRTGNEKPDL